MPAAAAAAAAAAALRVVTVAPVAAVLLEPLELWEPADPAETTEAEPWPPRAGANAFCAEVREPRQPADAADMEGFVAPAALVAAALALAARGVLPADPPLAALRVSLLDALGKVIAPSSGAEPVNVAAGRLGGFQTWCGCVRNISSYSA